MSRSLSSFTAPDYAFTLQGTLLLANGFYTLFFPDAAAEPPSPLAGAGTGVVHALSMTSFSLGVSYLIAVYQRNRMYMAAAVPLRFLALFVFLRHGNKWRKVGVYEAAMGTLTAGTLLWEKRR